MRDSRINYIVVGCFTLVVLVGLVVSIALQVLLALETARSIDEVLALAPTVGIPGQNLVVGDDAGRIAWTLLGRVPRGAGPDRLFGAVEFRDASDHPRIADPPVGRLWTANQRVVSGDLEVVMGDDEVDVGAGGYDIGARARQIRDDLLSLSHPATEADMLAIQLDSRALFLARWRDLLLTLLDEDAMRDSPLRREFRTLVSEGKSEARADAVGYRLVRTFRTHTLNALWRSLTQRHRDLYEDPSIGGIDPGLELDEHLRHPNLHRCWVAEQDGRIVGFCALLLHGEESELEPIVVEPDHRHRGVGALLAREAIAESRRLAVRYVNVRPVARNLEAIRFFHRERSETRSSPS